jgi:PAS domain S-box-containing protein
MADQSFSRKSDLQFRRLLEKLPAGAYTCGPEGLITYFNQHAVQLWGRAPKLNDPEDRFCGSFKLYATDGSPITHDRCWMALALEMNQEYNEREIVVERPDGQRLTVLAHANPIHDESGQLIGAVNVLVNISDRKRAEEAVREVRKYERRRIARDLHDGVLQDLAYAVRTLEMTKLDAEGTGLEEGMQEGIHTIQRAVQELRGTVYDLHIGDEEDLPFPDLLESLVERNRGMARGYEIDLEVEQGFASSLGETGTELLRIVQEALTNARRHSEAGRVVVSLSAMTAIW